MNRVTKTFTLIITVIFIMVIFCSCSSSIEGEIVFGTALNVSVEGIGSSRATDEILENFLAIEKEISVTNPDSYISKINSAKAGEKIIVPERVYSLIKLSKEWYRLSDGLFNPAIYPISLLWGLDSRHINDEKTSIPSEAEINEVLPYSDMDTFILDENDLSVTKLYDDSRLELGGIGKGYAIDCGMELASDYSSVLINAGGEIGIGKDEKRIGIQSPFSSSKIDYVITAFGVSIATSGTYEKYFTYNDKQYNHIIDKSGHPSTSSIVSVTVLGESATVCDILATIGILDYDAFSRLATEYKYSALIIYQDGTLKTLGDVRYTRYNYNE